MKILFALLFIASFLLEITVTTVPLMFICILFLTLTYRNYWIFALGFLVGLLLDCLLFRIPGVSSLFFVSFTFIVLMYQKKFEIFTFPFIFAASFLGSFAYLVLVGNTNLIILQTITVSIIAVAVFTLLSRTIKDKLLVSKT